MYILLPIILQVNNMLFFLLQYGKLQSSYFVFPENIQF